MVNVTVKMYNLQELVRKVYLNGLINEAVIQFNDGRMKIEAIGIEDEQGIIDNTLTVDVNYPCETKENGELSVKTLGDFLVKLELFERDDTVSLITTIKNEVVITRVEPYQSLTYELADKKFIKSYSEGFKTVFGAPIRLIRMSDKKEKAIVFEANAVIDAQKLKDHGSKLSEINVESVPITIKDGKVHAIVKGETVSLERVVDGVSQCNGSASSLFEKSLLTIFKHAIGTATMRLKERGEIHVHYEHESMTADYLMQIYEKKQ